MYWTKEQKKWHCGFGARRALVPSLGCCCYHHLIPLHPLPAASTPTNIASLLMWISKVPPASRLVHTPSVTLLNWGSINEDLHCMSLHGCRQPWALCRTMKPSFCRLGACRNASFHHCTCNSQSVLAPQSLLCCDWDWVSFSVLARWSLVQVITLRRHAMLCNRLQRSNSSVVCMCSSWCSCYYNILTAFLFPSWCHVLTQGRKGKFRLPVQEVSSLREQVHVLGKMILDLQAHEREFMYYILYSTHAYQKLV